MFVTGANRGIGLQLTKQSLARGDRVLGACRRPAAALELAGLRDHHPGRVDIIELDVTDEESIAAAARASAALVEHIDVLFNIAGTKGNLTEDPFRNLSRTFGDIDAVSMASIYATNTIGALLVVQALCPLLTGGTIVNLTSSMGSNGLMNRGDWYAYRASKAALNIVSRALSFDLRDRGVVVVAMHPGWVKTAMGTEDAPLPLAESVSSLLGVVDGLTLDDSGTFLNWRGETLPW